MNTKHPVYAAAKRLVSTVRTGDEHGVAKLLVERLNLEIKKFEIKEDEAKLKRDFSSMYVSSLQSTLGEDVRELANGFSQEAAQ